MATKSIYYVTGLDGWGDEVPSDDDQSSFCALVEHRLSQLYPDADVTAEVRSDCLASRAEITGYGSDDVDAREIVEIAGVDVWNAWCAGERAPDAPSQK